MTTPGNGGLSDEIVVDITTRVTGGDVDAAVTDIMRQVVAAARTGLEGQAIELPPLDAEALVTGVQGAFNRVEEMARQMSANLGTTLRAGEGGGDLFRTQKQALEEYRDAWRRFYIDLENITNGAPLSTRGAAAIGSLPAEEIGRRAQIQYNQLAGGRTVDSTASGSYYSEEAMRAIAGGQITPPPTNQQDYLRSLGMGAGAAPYQPGDIEATVQRIEESIGKVALQGVEYSFDRYSGSFTGSGGAVTDPALMARLQQQLMNQLAIAAETSVRELGGELAQRAPGLVPELGTPTADIGAGIPAHELAPDIRNLSGPLDEQISQLQEIRQGWESLIGSAAPGIERLTGLINELTTRQENLRAVLADPGGAASRQIQQAQAAIEEQVNEFRLRNTTEPQAPLALPAGSSRQPLAIESAQVRAGTGVLPQGIDERTLQHTQEVLAETSRVVEEYRTRFTSAAVDINEAMAGMQFGPGLVGQWTELARAMDEWHAAGEQAVGGMETALGRYNALLRLTQEESAALVEQGPKFALSGARLQQATEVGFGVGGQPAVRWGQNVLPVDPTTGQVHTEESLKREQALLAIEKDITEQVTLQHERANQPTAEPGGAGGGGGFIHSVLQGLSGGASGGGNSLERVQKAGGEFLGSIARYQLAYGVIYSLQRAMSDALHEQEQFEDAQVDLRAALDGTNQSVDRLADSYGRAATAAGQSDVTGVQAGSRGIFAFGAQGQPNAGAVGATSTQAAMVGMVLTGGQLQAVQQGLINTTNAFNLGFEGQTRVLDAAVNAYHRYGTATGDVLSSLPAVAEQARQGGLSLEQTANLISLIGSRTQQTGNAAGTALGRIFQQMQGANWQTAARSVGIDTGQDQAQQLDELAHKWGQLDTAQQNAIVHSLTGSRGASALIAILEDQGRALDQNATAADAAGVAQSEYYRHLATLGGEITIIHGDLTQLEHDFANSGIGDIFGIALRTVDPFLNGLDDILRVVGAIDQASHHWVGTILELAVAYRILAAAQATSAVAGGADAVEGAASGGLLRRGLTRSRTVLGRAFSRGGAAAAEGAGEETGALALGISPAGWAIGGAIALTAVIGGLTESAQRQSRAHDEAIQAEKELFNARSADDFNTAAANLATASVDIQHASGGMFGWATGGDQGSSGVRANARWAAQQAAIIAAEQQQDAGQHVSQYFTGNDFTSSVRNGLSSMSAAAIPAAQQLHLLAQAISGAGDAAGQTAGPVNTTDQRRSIVQAIMGARVEGWEREGRGAVRTSAAIGDPHGGLQAGTIQSYVDDAMRQLGIQPGQAITPDQQQQLATIVTAEVTKRFGRDQRAAHGAANVNYDPAAISTAVNRGISGAFANPDQAAATQGLTNPNDIATFFYGQVDPSDTSGKTRLTSGFQAIQNQASAAQNALDPTQSVQGAQASITAMRAALDAARQFNPAVYEQFAQQGNQLIEGWVKQVADNMGKVATAAASHSKNPIAGVRAEFNNIAGAHGEGLYLAQQGDVTDLITLLDSANQAEVDGLRSYIQSRVSDLRAALTAAQHELDADLAALNNLPGQVRNANRADILQGPEAAVDAAKKALGPWLNVLKTLNSATGQSTATDSSPEAQLAKQQSAIMAAPAAGDEVGLARARVQSDNAALSFYKAKGDWQHYHDTQRQLKDDTLAVAQAQTAVGNAQRDAAVIPGSEVSRTHAAVQDAQANLATAVRGTAAWFQAEGQLRQANVDYQNALIKASTLAAQASSDLTDPVAQARIDVQNAARQLGYDRSRHAGPDTINQDEINAQNARNRAQAAAFDQRMHDVQYLHDTQQISDAQYLQYLEHEHDRLHDIRNRTRQQTEEMQQVDEAIVAARHQLAGQFNIGAIRMPTPYEVRRAIESQNVGVTYQSQHTQTVSITISDQTSDQKVRQILAEYVGAGPRGRITSQPPKVPR